MQSNDSTVPDLSSSENLDIDPYCPAVPPGLYAHELNAATDDIDEDAQILEQLQHQAESHYEYDRHAEEDECEGGVLVAELEDSTMQLLQATNKLTEQMNESQAHDSSELVQAICTLNESYARFKDQHTSSPPVEDTAPAVPITCIELDVACCVHQLYQAILTNKDTCDAEGQNTHHVNVAPLATLVYTHMHSAWCGEYSKTVMLSGITDNRRTKTAGDKKRLTCQGMRKRYMTCLNELKAFNPRISRPAFSNTVIEIDKRSHAFSKRHGFVGVRFRDSEEITTLLKNTTVKLGTDYSKCCNFKKLRKPGTDKSTIKFDGQVPAECTLWNLLDDAEEFVKDVSNLAREGSKTDGVFNSRKWSRRTTSGKQKRSDEPSASTKKGKKAQTLSLDSVVHENDAILLTELHQMMSDLPGSIDPEIYAFNSNGDCTSYAATRNECHVFALKANDSLPVNVSGKTLTVNHIVRHVRFYRFLVNKHELT